MLPSAIYNIAISNGKEGRAMTNAQEILKKDIENINDDIVIEKIRIFIMGMLTQQSLSEQQCDSSKQFV